MDDLQSTISQILSDEESMRRLQGLAEQLFEGGNEKPTENSNNSPALPQGIDMQKIMHIISKLQSNSNDSRTRLLLALKENLSEKKAARVDSAVKILKLIELIPLIKETDIFNYF